MVNATSGTQVISNLRAAHGTLGQNIQTVQGIKVAQTTGIISAQGQRQNASPIRLQTSAGSNLVALVAPTQTNQQQSAGQQQTSSSTVTIQDSSSSSSGQQSPIINQQQIQISPQSSSQEQSPQSQSSPQSQQVSIIKRL